MAYLSTRENTILERITAPVLINSRAMAAPRPDGQKVDPGAVARHAPLLLLLAASVVLRVVLVRSGGQGYWPDERSYDIAREMLAALARGDYAAMIAQAEGDGPMLFKLIALVPAAFEAYAGRNLQVPGLFFAMFSVCNIVLVGRLAKGLGGSNAEALLASTMFAVSSSMFYYARHLQSYDLAMTFALVAILIGVRSGSTLRGCFVSGLIAACVFFAYNGYWTLAAAVPLLNGVAWSRPAGDSIRRALASAAGMCAMAGLIVGSNALLGGHLIRSYGTFAATVIQGDFEEGFWLPFDYLWHAEHGLLIVWLVGLGWGLATMGRSWASPRVRVALTGLLVVYASLAITSTFLHVFVVYGRLARQLVPFFCLVTAYGLERLRISRSVAIRALVPATIVMLLAQAAVNFQQPLQQTFPADLRRQYGASDQSPLVWVNVEYFYPEPRPVVLPDRLVLVHEATHPFQFLPYQYEGFTFAQREVLRSTDIRMRILARLP